MSKKDRSRQISSNVPAGFYLQPRLHFTFPGELEVENCKGILLCTSQMIRLDLGRQAVLVRGDELRLLSAQTRLLRICGQIFSIEFSSGEEVSVP